ncbi:hypothetical protein C8J57DRAFT_125624 [Mycena rebaudengoi]|nr:hypothetical protein C8J57DRAFT_125624 [Mycena rebaudengoi]
MSTGVSVEGFTPFLVGKSYPKDRKALKYLVGICVLLNTAQLGVLACTLYFWLITCRLPQNYPLLGSLKRSMVPSYLTYFLTTAVQCFYAMRVWFVSNKNKYLVSAIIFLSFTQMAGSLELGSSMLCDILITASLVYCLRGSVASFKGTPRTRNAINKIVMYSVNTGIVTNIVTMMDLVTWLAAPETDHTWAVFHFALGKIYVCSMLVSLNSRQDIRQIMDSGPRLTTTFNIDARPGSFS